jgi:Leucine-rich repeat (LRR) protein
MITLQEWLNQQYPTLEEKSQLKKITIGRKHGFESNLLLTQKQAKELEGGELDLSDYPNLEQVAIWGNYYLKTPLTKLELGEKSRLADLFCLKNQLTTLDLSKCPNLEEVSCRENQLTNLNIQSCSKLKKLDYKHNPLFNDLKLNQAFVNSLNFADYPILERGFLLNWEEIHKSFSEISYWGDKVTYQQWWEEKGFDYQNAQEWIAVGFEPQEYYEVGQWKNHNFAPQEAETWVELGFTENSFDQFHSKNFSRKLKEVLIWKKEFTPEQVKELIEVNFFLSDSWFAKKWKNSGFSFEEIKEWTKAGLNSQEVNFAKHLKQNNIQPSQLTTDNLSQLEKEFYPNFPQAQGYLDINYPCDCDESDRDEYGQLIHKKDCSKKHLSELNLRNLDLEGDLDLKGFYSSYDNPLKVYLAGNSNLGEIKNMHHDAILIYQSPERWLNEKYPDKKQVEVISLGKLDFEQPGKLIIDGYSDLKEMYGHETFNIIKLTIRNCSQLKKISIGSLKKFQQLTLDNLPNLRELDCGRNNLTKLEITNCPNLEEIDCSNNQLSEIKFPSAAREKLEVLNLWANSFNQDLSSFKDLVNLKHLYLGSNDFYGSLEFLKNLRKLEILSIYDTDINSGLEYLPDSLKNFRSEPPSMLHITRKTKCQNITEILRPHGGTIQGWRLAQEKSGLTQQVQFLQKQQSLFQEKEQEIIYLETRIRELANLIKTQKQKIINDFLNILSERELIQQLITTYLEFKKAEKQGISSIDLEDQYLEVKKELREKQGKEFMEKLQLILKDCEELVSWELELEERLKGRAFLIEEQKQILKQITYSSKNEELVKKHEETDQEQAKEVEKIKQQNLIFQLEKAKLEGKLEVYERPITPQFNEDTTWLIAQLKEKQELTSDEINHIGNYLKTKKDFLVARQETIKELRECYNKLEKKYKKQEIIGEIGNVTSNVGGAITNVITFGIPKAVGEAIKAKSNFSKIKLSKKGSEQFQIFLSNEKNELTQLNRNYDSLVNSLSILSLKDKLEEKEPKLFNLNYEVFDILINDSIWPGRSLNLEEMKKAITSLSQNLNELKTELEKEEKQFKELTSEVDKNPRAKEKRQLSIDSQTKNAQEKDKLPRIDEEKIGYSESMQVDYNWQNIHPNFTEELQKSWKNLKFSYMQTKDWINIGLTPQDYQLAYFLKNIKNLTPEKVLNHENVECLKIEYEQSRQTAQILQNQPYGTPSSSK